MQIAHLKNFSYLQLLSEQNNSFQDRTYSTDIITYLNLFLESLPSHSLTDIVASALTRSRPGAQQIQIPNKINIKEICCQCAFTDSSAQTSTAITKAKIQ